MGIWVGGSGRCCEVSIINRFAKLNMHSPFPLTTSSFIMFSVSFHLWLYRGSFNHDDQVFLSSSTFPQSVQSNRGMRVASTSYVENLLTLTLWRLWYWLLGLTLPCISFIPVFSVLGKNLFSCSCSFRPGTEMASTWATHSNACVTNEGGDSVHSTTS